MPGLPARLKKREIKEKDPSLPLLHARAVRRTIDGSSTSPLAKEEFVLQSRKDLVPSTLAVPNTIDNVVSIDAYRFSQSPIETIKKPISSPTREGTLRDSTAEIILSPSTIEEVPFLALLPAKPEGKVDFNPDSNKHSTEREPRGHDSRSDANTEGHTGDAILSALKDASGYISSSRLAHISGLSVEAIRAFAATHPDKVRKSLIRAPNGEAVYILNTRLGWLFDSWHAFCHLNAKKFS